MADPKVTFEALLGQHFAGKNGGSHRPELDRILEEIEQTHGKEFHDKFVGMLLEDNVPSTTISEMLANPALGYTLTNDPIARYRKKLRAYVNAKGTA